MAYFLAYRLCMPLCLGPIGYFGRGGHSGRGGYNGDGVAT